MKQALLFLTMLAASWGSAHAQRVATIAIYDDDGAHATGSRPAHPLVQHPAVGAPVATAYPMLLWPLGVPQNTDSFLSNYVDDDQGSPSLTDYMGGHTHLYNDHKGTDVALFNFRLMDRGIPVVAAAGGVVTHTIYHYGDRNTTMPYPDGGNGLGIQHDDGSLAYYWHVRTNSVTVEPGERIEAGQVLAYVGSSGWTPIPHLHFELSGARDPWHGTYQTAPSLWLDQPAYMGDAPLWVMDMDLFTLDAVGGSLSNFDDRAVKERVSSPAVLGTDESTVYVWAQIQGNTGDPFRIELVQPDGSIADAFDEVLSHKYRYGWLAYAFTMPASATPGTWTLRTISDGRLLMERPIEVGDETQYPPRFLPVAGRSVRLGEGGYQEPLSAAVLGQTVNYHLVDAPSNVRLEGETLVVDAPSPQPYRSRYFQVVATDAQARTDTLWYHLVDPSKTLDPIQTSIDEGAQAEPREITLAQNHPNPAQATTTILYELLQPAPVRLRVFDALGREVATLVDAPRPAGNHAVAFDTAGLSAGLYTYRLETDSETQSRAMVVIR